MMRTAPCAGSCTHIGTKHNGGKTGLLIWPSRHQYRDRVDDPDRFIMDVSDAADCAKPTGLFGVI